MLLITSFICGVVVGATVYAWWVQDHVKALRNVIAEKDAVISRQSLLFLKQGKGKHGIEIDPDDA